MDGRERGGLQVSGIVEPVGAGKCRLGLRGGGGHEEERDQQGCPGWLPCMDYQCPVFREACGWPGHHLEAPMGQELLGFYS